MKPLKLTLINFGGYASPTTFDFTKVESPYTIRGRTGAGKSSIGEAISIALFGDAPKIHKDRSATLKSYVNDSSEAKTFKIIFEFLAQGKVYRITRELTGIQLEVKNEKGEFEPFVGDDASSAEKIKDVKKTIEALIGYGFDTFSRIELIPQMAFTKLLRPDEPRQRREIILSLAGCDVYSAFGKYVKRELTLLKRRAAGLETEVAALERLEKAIYEAKEKTEAPVVVAGDAAKAMEYVDDLKQLARLAEQIESLRAGKAGKFEVLSEEALNEIHMLCTMHDYNDCSAKMLSSCNSLLEKLASRMNELEQVKAKAIEKIAQLNSKKEELERQIEQLKEYKNSQDFRRLEELETKLDSLFAEKGQLERKLSSESLREFHIDELLELPYEEFDVSIRAQELAEKKTELLLEKDKIIAEGKRLKSEQEKIVVEGQKLREEYNSLTKDIEALERRYEEAMQAGALLEVCQGVHDRRDTICPVCDNTLTKEQLEQKILEQKSRQIELTRCKLELNNAKKTAAEKQEALHKSREKYHLTAKSIEFARERLRAINEQLQNTQHNGEVHPLLKGKEAKEIVRLKNSKSAYDANKALYLQEQEAAAQMRKRIEEIDLEIEQNKQRYIEMLKNTSGGDITITPNKKASSAIDNEIARIGNEVVAIVKEINSQEKIISEGERETDNIRSRMEKGTTTVTHLMRIRTILDEAGLGDNNFNGKDIKVKIAEEVKRRKNTAEKEIARKNFKETLKLIASKTGLAQKVIEENYKGWIVLRQRYDEFTQKQRIREAEIEQLRKQAEPYKDSRKKLREADKEIRILTEISKDFSGDQLQLYMEKLFMPEILAKASEYLEHMSSGKYIFQFGDKGEILIYNQKTAVSRPIHTLSGGETFQASLALILGLRNMPWMPGNVESLIIDEGGFSALDTDGALNTALDSIETVAALFPDMHIAIVTHVPGVVERFPSGIEIKEMANGDRKVIYT